MPHPLDEIVNRYGSRTGVGGYVFVTNVGELPDGEHTLGDGFVLRRATTLEAEEIRMLHAFYKTPFRPTVPWETIASVDSSDTSRTLFHPRDPSDFRYHVLEHRALDGQRSVERASFLARGASLEFGVSVSWMDGLVGAADAVAPSNFLRRATWNPNELVRFSSEEIADLAALVPKVTLLSDPLSSLACALDDFRAVETVPDGVRIRLLGYFAILEALVTHKPEPTDPYQSITRQVRMKVRLLSARFERSVDYARFVGSALSPEKLWTKLYDLRSTIAHGRVPDFQRSHLVLRSLHDAELLVREVVRSVMRQALEEPELIDHLREC